MMNDISKDISLVLEEAKQNVRQTPWCFLIADELASDYQNFSKFFKKELVWIGIGGSSSGPRAFFRIFDIKGTFLESPEDDFEGNFRKKLFYVVSKSGTTYETLILFDKIIKKLKVSGGNISSSVIINSQDVDSPMSRIARKYNIQIIPFPPQLSGRFSTFYIMYFYLSAMYPKILKGVCRGLSEVRNSLTNQDSLHFKLASFLLQNLDKQDLFLCFYSRKIFELSENISQLIAESLGKDNKGFTPVANLGPNFQHSMAQLVLANPKSKFSIFIVPKGRRYEQVRREAGATYRAFSEKIPSMWIDFEQTPSEISKLVFSFQIAIAVCGKIMGINPFDQPEVKRIRDMLEL